MFRPILLAARTRTPLAAVPSGRGTFTLRAVQARWSTTPYVASFVTQDQSLEGTTQASDGYKYRLLSANVGRPCRLRVFHPARVVAVVETTEERRGLVHRIVTASVAYHDWLTVPRSELSDTDITSWQTWARLLTLALPSSRFLSLLV